MVWFAAMHLWSVRYAVKVTKEDANTVAWYGDLRTSRQSKAKG